MHCADRACCNGWRSCGLRPVVRRNDLRGEPKPGGIQVLDWTFLVVRDVNEYLLDCDVYSAMRNPLTGRSSRTRMPSSSSGIALSSARC